MSTKMVLPALTLKDYGKRHNNFASLVLTGVKSIETRTWRTTFRGDFLITCSMSSKSENAGLALCVAELVHIEPMKESHEKLACCPIYPKAFSWYLSNLRLLSRKFPVKGQLKFFDVEIPDDVTFIPAQFLYKNPEYPKAPVQELIGF